MTHRLAFALALLALPALVACTPRRATPTAAAGASNGSSRIPPPTAAASASAASSNADAGASANADADAGRPCVPSGPFAAALREGALLDYDVDDDVDPHGTEPGRVRTRSKITFRVTRVDCEGDAVVASGEWEGEGAESLPTQLPRQWRVAHGRVIESDAAEFAESELARAKAPLCRTATDRGPYGKTVRRVCIDGRGLTSLREENLYGPRVLVITRRVGR